MMGRYRIVGLSPATGSGSSSAAEPLVWPQNDRLSCARSFLSTVLRAAGIQPLSWLPLRSTVSRVLLRLPSAAGIAPVSRLLRRRKICSWERRAAMTGCKWNSGTRSRMLAAQIDSPSLCSVMSWPQRSGGNSYAARSKWPWPLRSG